MSAKSAKKYRERLEGSYRLIRIKKVKRMFFLIQIIIAIAIACAISYLDGMRFEPFFFPTDTFLFISLIFMVAMAGEGVYFKGVEVKFTKSKSRRFLIARNSIRASGVTIILSALLIAMLLLPLTDEYLSDTFENDLENRGENIPLDLGPYGSDDDTAMFELVSHHPLGLVRLNNLVVSVNSIETLDLDITIRNEKSRDLISRPLYSNQENTYDLIEYSSSNLELNAIIENTDDTTPAIGAFDYSIDYGMSTTFTLLIPIILVIMVIIQMVSISIMLPLRELYASSSIYSKNYVQEKEEGVEKMSERMKAEKLAKQKEEEEQAALAETIDMAELEATLAPPPPVKVKEADKGPVTKMGDLDADLQEEADIACPKCGELNSPHAAMCFVCGNPMVVADTIVDINEIIARGENSIIAKKYAEATRFFDEAIRHDNTNEKALLGKGKALNLDGKWGIAIQYVNTVVNMNPNNVDALLLKGQILEARGKTEMALEIYDKIMIIDPTIKIAASKKEELAVEIEDMIIAAAATQSEGVAMTGDAVEEDEQAVVESFMELPGIGLAKASALYQAGFTNMNQLRSASEEELTKVKGISARLAKKIKG